MESKFSNTDNFERFLRDKADEFKMYPSRRVWYSIYNNMHPGNRMPSVAMSIILICALLLTGYLNTSTKEASRINTTSVAIKTDSKQSNVVADNVTDATAAITTGKYSTSSTAPVEFNNTNKPVVSAAVNNNNTISTSSSFAHRRFGRASMNSVAGTVGEETTNTVSTPGNSITEIASTTQSNQQTVTADADNTINQVNNNIIAPATKSSNIITTTIPVVKVMSEDDSYTTSASSSDNNRQRSLNESNSAIPVTQATVASEKSASEIEENNVVVNKKVADEKNNSEASNAGNNNNNTLLAVTTVSENDKAWIENYAMYNKSAAPKWKGKLSWQAYITPGIVYRTLTNNTADKVMAGNGSGNFNNSNVSAVVKHKPSFGFEAGVGLQYDLMKRVKVRGALQVNYTRYNALAYENQHPISTSLTMNGDDGSAYEVFRSTIYSSNLGLHEVKLHNETLQLSIPMGADFRISTLGNISWYAGATIQPTVILKANSYLISSDRRNYVKDQSMLNRFNLNAGFETYLSIKTDNYTWQVGPQFRSQIFSTNNKLYSVEERLMTFGIKLGITRRL